MFPKKSYIVLFGDIMLDHRIEGNCHKIANEAPIPVVHMTHETYQLGGCGNVLSNLVALGAKQVFLFSRIGNDAHATTLTGLLPASTQPHLLVDPHLPTITKHRVYSNRSLLCRYDEEKVCPLSVEQEETILQQFSELLQTQPITSVICSDYNKGFLTSNLCQQIISRCNQVGIPTIVDPKGDINKYRHCTVLKPNRSETLALLGLDLSTLSYLEAHQQIHEKMDCQLSVITLSGDGISGYQDSIHHHVWEETKEIIDVTGAGDVVCSVLGILYPCNKNLKLHLQIANHLASLSVGHLGSYTITSKDLIHTLQFLQSSKQIDLDRLPTFFKNRIVFTNGCFDILHSAHMALFRFCKELGDIVIVGINSDESIQRLKGPTRPICKLEDRIAMLEAIQYIDFIIPFEEDTPLRLLERIRPTYLVKGGDYTIDTIIGKEFAQEVVLFEYVPGKSTTQLIHQVQSILSLPEEESSLP
jgi:D-beta-D-heptose 7-phosphate kinase / D-beta-D-heptose 1-phosphate adenosyltransferase